MYENGTSGRAVARILGVSPNAVYKWIKKAEHALRVREERTTNNLKKRMAKAISIDEMVSYQRARRGPGRNVVWIWTAVIEWFDGSQSSDFVIGKGGKVNRNEGLHSRLRDSLYRLRRRAKGLTRCLRMLEASISLVAVAKGFL